MSRPTSELLQDALLTELEASSEILKDAVVFIMLRASRRVGVASPATASPDSPERPIAKPVGKPIAVASDELFGQPWCLITNPEHPINPDHGFVYALEYDEYLKIGSTRQPSQRLAALGAQIRNYGDRTAKLGRMVISPPHRAYRLTEKQFHNLFAARRTRGELFQMTLEEFLASVAGCQFDEQPVTATGD